MVDKQSRPRPGAENFKREKNYRKAINQRHAQTDVFVCTSLQPFRLVLASWWWLVLFPWCVWCWCCKVM